MSKPGTPTSASPAGSACYEKCDTGKPGAGKGAGRHVPPAPRRRPPKVCQKMCALVPNNVPLRPGAVQEGLHPRKDVFVIKVAKVSPSGDRRCKMELELVTPQYTGNRPLPYRVDTRETQCDDECKCECSRKCKSVV